MSYEYYALDNRGWLVHAFIHALGMIFLTMAARMIDDERSHAGSAFMQTVLPLDFRG